jgi:hypothetical protein
VFTVAEVLSQMVRLLQVQDISVNLCCLDVLRLLAIEPNTVKVLGGLGLYDILDSIQVLFHIQPHCSDCGSLVSSYHSNNLPAWSLALTTVRPRRGQYASSGTLTR